MWLRMRKPSLVKSAAIYYLTTIVFVTIIASSNTTTAPPLRETTTMAMKAMSSSLASATSTCGFLKTSQLFLGTMGISGANNDTVGKATHSAIASGYRYIDCAPVYFNEELIGDALRNEFNAGTVHREDIFITSKLACPFHRKEHVEMALRKTLSDLRLDYLDLYLMHWPVAFNFVQIDATRRGWENEAIDDSDEGRNIDPTVSVKETWTAMEELVDKGLVRSIGVSNFPVSLLHELLTTARIKPVVNQVEIHPYLQQQKLLNYCASRGIHVMAYSPLGTPGYKEENEPAVLDDPVLLDIASDKEITVAQLSLAWALQRGYSVVAKSASPERQRQNIHVVTATTEENHPQLLLSEDEMKRISELDRGYRFFRPEEWWGEMNMAVFD